MQLTSLKQNPIYQAEAPVQGIVSDLHQIVELDQEVERRQRQARQVMVWCIGGAIALLFFSVLLGSLNLFLAPLLFAGGMLLVGGAIVAGIIRSRYVSINIPNYRYELLPQLLQMLVRDMDNQAPVKTQVVLSPPKQPDKCVHQGPHPHRPNWEQKRFADLWLTLEGQFLDHTQFQVQCTELWVQSSGWKRGRSGKMKHKSKTKPKGFDLFLALRVSRKKYGALPVLSADAQSAVQLPPSCTLKSLQVNDNQLSMRVRVQSLVQTATQVNDLYQAITSMFLSAYQILNLARELSKPNVGA